MNFFFRERESFLETFSVIQKYFWRFTPLLLCSWSPSKTIRLQTSFRSGLANVIDSPDRRHICFVYLCGGMLQRGKLQSQCLTARQWWLLQTLKNYIVCYLPRCMALLQVRFFQVFSLTVLLWLNVAAAPSILKPIDDVWNPYRGQAFFFLYFLIVLSPSPLCVFVCVCVSFCACVCMCTYLPTYYIYALIYMCDSLLPVMSIVQTQSCSFVVPVAWLQSYHRQEYWQIFRTLGGITVEETYRGWGHS